jgi:predicted alpha/beta-hydrolase family hydrolase
MRHRFMESAVARLHDRGIATFRYQFPYTERGGRRPDRAAVLVATVRAAVETAGRIARDLPLLAGGKSMGGRMTSLACSEAPLPNVRGLAFFGFPLHAAGRPSSERGDHLRGVGLPMLFLQGTRDALADLDRISSVAHGLGSRATLKVIEGADHSFHVLKRSGRNDDEVLDEIGEAVTKWAAGIDPGGPRS